MSQKAMTKDEMFLMKLYELASIAGDPQQEIDRYVVGKAIGQNDRGINAMSILLAKANFIKKGQQDMAYYLTDNGLRLVQQLLSERA